MTQMFSETAISTWLWVMCFYCNACSELLEFSTWQMIIRNTKKNTETNKIERPYNNRRELQQHT